MPEDRERVLAWLSSPWAEPFLPHLGGRSEAIVSDLVGLDLSRGEAALWLTVLWRAGCGDEAASRRPPAPVTEQFRSVFHRFIDCNLWLDIGATAGALVDSEQHRVESNLRELVMGLRVERLLDELQGVLSGVEFGALIEWLGAIRLAEMPDTKPLRLPGQPRPDVVAGYLRYGAHQREEDWWAWEEVNDLAHDAPEVGWELVLRLIDAAPDEHLLFFVAAGPLEDLVCLHGPALIDEMEVAMRQRPRVREAMSGVNLSSADPDVRARIERLLGPVA